jgi:hypothetical protein
VRTLTGREVAALHGYAPVRRDSPRGKVSGGHDAAAARGRIEAAAKTKSAACMVGWSAARLDISNRN